MARRMFSPNIVSSDAFIDMPISTQALYFHLGMNADDDGFVNPKRVMRMIGISDDDLKILVSKRFVLPFENGVVVIKHWRMNNLVRKDWYRPTVYVEQKNLLFIKENGVYTDDCTQGKCLVNELVNVGKDRIGKNINSKTEVLQITSKNKNMKTYNETNPYEEPSIDLDTGEKTEKKPQTKKYPNALKVFNLFGKYPLNWKINKTQLQSAENLFTERGLEQILKAIQFYRDNKGGEFCPIINSPYDLDSKWAKLISFKKRK